MGGVALLLTSGGVPDLLRMGSKFSVSSVQCLASLLNRRVAPLAVVAGGAVVREVVASYVLVVTVVWFSISRGAAWFSSGSTCRAELGAGLRPRVTSGISGA